jgi:hypothetical protein
MLTLSKEMQGTIEFLTRSVNELAKIEASVGNVQLLGNFPEGQWLMQRHQDALCDVATLIQYLTDGMNFANDIGKWVTSQFVQTDQGVGMDFMNIAKSV